jgi:hypothetical protein
MQSDYQTRRLPRKNSQKPERDAVPTQPQKARVTGDANDPQKVDA